MISFGPYRIDLQRRLLLFDSQTLKLEKIPLEILLLLIRQRHRVVSREEIANHVWGKDKYVEATDGINTAIRKIRKALEDSTEEPRFIQTVIGQGYSFIGEVQESPEPSVDPEPINSPKSTNRFAQPRTLFAAGLLAVALFAIFAFLRPKSAPADSFVSLSRLTSDTGFTGWPDISPDGKMLAFASNRADSENFDIYIQPVEGTQAIRLTSHASKDVSPVISPKGDRVAFESLREPAGIYTVPLLGGEAHLLAKDGSHPRYSPDGAWVAYFKAEKAGTAALLQSDRRPAWSSWIISTSGGDPIPLHPGMVVGNPVWAGNDFLLLTGYKPGEAMDWWVTPRDGSWIKPLGVHAALSKNFPDIPAAWSSWTPSYFQDGAAVFSARTRDGANLWRIHFSTDWKPSFPPQRVTMMSDHVRDPAISANGRIAAAVANKNIDIYELPLDADSGRVTGTLKRITHAKTSEQFVSSTQNGNLLAYTSWRNGDAGDLYLLDSNTGVERQLTSTPDWESFPRISPNGTNVLYRWSNANREWGTRRLQVRSGSIETVCRNCVFMDETADTKSFLYGDAKSEHIFVQDYSGGTPTEPIHDPSLRLVSASLDASNRWIAFVASSPNDPHHRLYVAPYSRGARLTRKDWVPMGTGLTPIWSPNGKWLYFDESHDGYRCIWAQQFDPIAGKPIGARVSIAHIHGDQRLLMAESFKDRAIARDRLFLSISEETSNVWLMR